MVLSLSRRPCGCRDVTDGCGHVLIVGTCPQCLPAGAITWLIENGRQLEMFGPEPLEERGVTLCVSGDEPDDYHPEIPLFPGWEKDLSFRSWYRKVHRRWRDGT